MTLERGRILGTTAVKNITRKPTETTNLAHRVSQSLNQQRGIQYGTRLGPLYTCDSGELDLLVGPLTMGAGLSLML